MGLEKIYFNWPIINKNCLCGHISCTIGMNYGHFVHDLPYIIPTKKQFIVSPSLKRFFKFQPIRNKNCPWRPCFCPIGLKWRNLRGLSNYPLFGQTVSEKNFRNWPTRNKNCLWRQCLLTNWDKMSNLYRGPSIDASYQVSVHLAKQFQKRKCLEIDQLETRVGYVC